MKKIKRLSDHIREELEDADEYIRQALECKETDKTIADVYANLAGEELKHADILHEQVVKAINAYKAVNGDPPENMQVRYDILHEIHVADAQRIKLKIKLYKEE